MYMGTTLIFLLIELIMYHCTVKNFKNESVISVEIPTRTNTDIWNKPEKYLEEIWLEVKKMKMVDENEKFINYKIFKIQKQ